MARRSLPALAHRRSDSASVVGASTPHSKRAKNPAPGTSGGDPSVPSSSRDSPVAMIHGTMRPSIARESRTVGPEGQTCPSGRHTFDNAFQYCPGAQSSAGRGVWQVLVMGSQNCPFTQLSGSAEPFPALNNDTAMTGTATMVDRRKRFRMPGVCPDPTSSNAVGSGLIKEGASGIRTLARPVVNCPDLERRRHPSSVGDTRHQQILFAPMTPSSRIAAISSDLPLRSSARGVQASRGESACPRLDGIRIRKRVSSVTSTERTGGHLHHPLALKPGRPPSHASQ